MSGLVFRFWRWLSHVGHFCDIWSVSWKSADRGCALIMPNKFQWYIFFENKTYFWKKTKHHQSEPTLPRKVLLNLSSSFFEIFQRNFRKTSHNVATKCCHQILSFRTAVNSASGVKTPMGGGIPFGKLYQNYPEWICYYFCLYFYIFIF